MPSPVADFLADLARVLADLQVRWYLFGAQAALLYGAARLTADVDITLQMPRTVTTAQLADSLGQHGFRVRVSDPAFIAHTRVVPIEHMASGLPADLVLGGPGLEEEFLARAIIREIEGVPVPVASAEDIVVMKILAGRGKDLEDVSAILRAQRGTIDMLRVRTVLEQLEEALGQSDLMPLLDQAAGRAQSRHRDRAEPLE